MSSSQPTEDFHLLDYGALLESKTKEMTRVKMLMLYEERIAELQAEEEKAVATMRKRESMPLVLPENEGAMPESVESASAVEPVPEPEESAINRDSPAPSPRSIDAVPTIPGVSRQTVVASGPYAGLQSAGKRRRDDTNPFAPPKKQHHKPGSPMLLQKINNRAPVNRGNLQTLRYFRTLIEQAVKVKPQDLQQHFAKIQKYLHQLEFYDFLSDDRNAKNLVEQSGLLQNDALPALADDSIPGVSVPTEIRLDCTALYRKWSSGNFDPHLLRGITTKQGTNKEGRKFRHHVLDKSHDFTVSCSYFGPGQLVIGQWWPLQICAVRDGAHGEMEAGIHGKTGEGAYSVVVSGGGYANIDRGDTIDYCGTPGDKDSPSTNTKHLIKSCELRKPVRVLRSAQLGVDNPWRPAQGLRYDGLYLVDGWEILDNDTAMYRFKLTRMAHQAPIRWEGPGVRPTEVEIRQHDEVKGLFGR